MRNESKIISNAEDVPIGKTIVNPFISFWNKEKHLNAENLIFCSISNVNRYRKKHQKNKK